MGGVSGVASTAASAADCNLKVRRPQQLRRAGSATAHGGSGSSEALFDDQFMDVPKVSTTRS